MINNMAIEKMGIAIRIAVFDCRSKSSFGRCASHLNK
jgi:hypothetical protein